MTSASIENSKPARFFSSIASAGEKSTIQETAAIVDNVSIAQGFPSIFSTPRADGGKSVSRKDMNAFLNMMSTLNYYFQYTGRNPWNSDIANTSKGGGYPKGAIVWHASTTAEYISTVDNNTTTPGATNSQWTKIGTSSGPIVNENTIKNIVNTTYLKTIVNRKYITDFLGYDYTLMVCTAETSGSPVSGTIYFITES